MKRKPGQDATSLALHRAVAERIGADPASLVQARERVRQWGEDGSVDAWYVERWTALLARSPAEVAAAITASGEEAAALRHVSPFAGMLTARERWAIWRAVRSERDDPRAA